MSEQYLEAAAKAGHDEYERIAPEYGYRTRTESAVEWEDLSGDMRDMMRRAYKAGIEAWVGDRELCEPVNATDPEWSSLKLEKLWVRRVSVKEGEPT